PARHARGAGGGGRRESGGCRPCLFCESALTFFSLPYMDFAQIFISLLVLLFSFTVHEIAHARTADRLRASTRRLLRRLPLTPSVPADPIGTILFPLVAAVANVPLIGWAKPVPVNVKQLRNPRRDYVLVAAAGPASNLVLAMIAAVIVRVIPISPVTIGEP